MEPLFENQYVCTHAMLAEFARKHGTGPRKPLVIFFAALYAVLLLLSLIFGVLGEVADTMVMTAVIFAVLCCLPHIYAWSILRGMKSQNDGCLPKTVVTFGDHIEMDEGMVHLTIEYRKIRRVIRLNHSYMLMLGRRNGVMLDPNGFTKGEFQAFRAFLHKKRPDLKIPK